MATLLLFTVLVDLPRVDDGGILARARLGSDSLFTSHLAAMHEGLALPQRGLYESLLGMSVGSSNIILVLRLPVLISGLIAWLAYRHIVLPRLADGHVPRRLILSVWSVYALFFVAWFPTLRPEPLISVMGVLALAVLVRWPREVSVWPYVALLGLSGAALSLHIAGLVVWSISAGMLWHLRTDVRRDLKKALAGLSWGLVAAVLPLLVGTNAQFLYDNAVGFRSASAGRGPLDTLDYLGILTGSPAMIISMVLTVVGLISIAASMSNRKKAESCAAWNPRSVMFGLLLSPIAFFVTPSKLPWHLGVLLPVALVGVTVLMHRIDQRESGLLGFSLVVSLYASAMIYLAVRLGNYGLSLSTYAFRSFNSDVWSIQFPTLFGSQASIGVWLSISMGVAILCLLIAFRIQQPRLATVVAGQMSLVAAIPVLTLLILPVVDAVSVESHDWTFARQSVGGLVSEEQACGLVTQLQRIEPTALEVGPGMRERRHTVVTGSRVAAMFMPCDKPVDQADGHWKFPDVVLGGLSDDQLRFLDEFALAEIACDDGVSGSLQEHCFYRLQPPTQTLAPTAIEWIR